MSAANAYARRAVLISSDEVMASIAYLIFL